MRPKGRYRAKGITGSGELTTSSEKGTEQVEVEFELLDTQWLGQTIRWIGFCTEKTVERTMESLRLMGWESDDISDLRGIDANEVELVIDHETYNGEERERVRWVNKIGGFRVGAPMDDAKKKAFAARMKGAAIKSRGAMGNGSSSGGAAADLPFGNNAKDNVGF